MPRVVPSQVVEFIDQVFPSARTEGDGTQGLPGLTARDSGFLSALVQLVETIPSELVVLGGKDYTDFVCCVSRIRQAIDTWPQQTGFVLRGDPRLSPLHPVTLIRNNLAACPDESPAASTAELIFVTDSELRQELRKDISSTNVALSNGEWKAATVLAGSVVEALLLWVLKDTEGQKVQAAKGKLLEDKRLEKDPGSELERWHLRDYIEVAANLKLISEETATATRLTRDFRNLIHPGRAQRLEHQCNRGTALSAVAAIEHVVRDISSRASRW